MDTPLEIEKPKKKRIRKHQHFTLMRFLTITFVVATTIALLVTNYYIPVKYLSAYMVSKKPPIEDAAQITFFDFDDGDCTLVTLPDRKTILIDGGGGGYTTEQRLIRTLNEKGIDTIDYMFLTSLRDSRLVGLIDIAKYKKVHKVFVPHVTIDTLASYENFFAALEKQQTEVEINSFGKGVKGDDYLLGILSPPADIYSESSPYYDMNRDLSSANINAASAVYWLEYDGVKVLLLGDSTEAVQNRVLRQYDMDTENFKVLGSTIDLVNFDIVKIAYGGRTSNYSARFMSRSTYSTAVITGDNLTVKTLSDLLGEEKQILSTHQSGDIVITISGGTFAVE